MELNKVLNATMDYAECKNKIFEEHIIDRGDGVFTIIGDESKLAERVVKMMLSVDTLLNNL